MSAGPLRRAEDLPGPRGLPLQERPSFTMTPVGLRLQLRERVDQRTR